MDNTRKPALLAAEEFRQTLAEQTREILKDVPAALLTPILDSFATELHSLQDIQLKAAKAEWEKHLTNEEEKK